MWNVKVCFVTCFLTVCVFFSTRFHVSFGAWVSDCFNAVRNTVKFTKFVDVVYKVACDSVSVWCVVDSCETTIVFNVVFRDVNGCLTFPVCKDDACNVVAHVFGLVFVASNRVNGTCFCDNFGFFRTCRFFDFSVVVCQGCFDLSFFVLNSLVGAHKSVFSRGYFVCFDGDIILSGCKVCFAVDAFVISTCHNSFLSVNVSLCFYLGFLSVRNSFVSVCKCV